jgi:hypothetical protein
MNTISDFYKGQKVQFKDGDTGDMVNGRVNRVEEFELDNPESINRVRIQWDDLMDPVWHYSNEFQQIILVSKRRPKVLMVLLVAGLFLTVSCTPSRKMVMPDGCKPPKKVEHEMIKPTPKIERNDTKDLPMPC